MASQRIAVFARPFPCCRSTIDDDLLAAEPRQVADNGTGAALALEAMANPDA
jgi:hypothetical protein